MSWSLSLGDTASWLSYMLPTRGALANAKIKPQVACGPGPVGQLIEICLNWLNIVRKNESPILITDAEETDKICGIIY